MVAVHRVEAGVVVDDGAGGAGAAAVEHLPGGEAGEGAVVGGVELEGPVADQLGVEPAVGGVVDVLVEDAEHVVADRGAGAVAVDAQRRGALVDLGEREADRVGLGAGDQRTAGAQHDVRRRVGRGAQHDLAAAGVGEPHRGRLVADGAEDERAVAQDERTGVGGERDRAVAEVGRGQPQAGGRLLVAQREGAAVDDEVGRVTVGLQHEGAGRGDVGAGRVLDGEGVEGGREDGAVLGGEGVEADLRGVEGDVGGGGSDPGRCRPSSSS